MPRVVLRQSKSQVSKKAKPVVDLSPPTAADNMVVCFSSSQRMCEWPPNTSNACYNAGVDDSVNPNEPSENTRNLADQPAVCEDYWSSTTNRSASSTYSTHDAVLQHRRRRRRRIDRNEGESFDLILSLSVRLSVFWVFSLFSEPRWLGEMHFRSHHNQTVWMLFDW